MSAVLSPAEQQDVTRFGIHDEDVIADLENHGDEVPTCDGCPSPAVARIVHTCCSTVELQCAPHLTALRKWIEERDRVVICTACRTRFVPPLSVEAIVKVVPL